MSVKPNHTNHLATLDGLRGIAAVAVLWYHIRELLQLNIPMPHVYMAVDFFFMLSGYVVAKAYEEKLNATMSFPDFIKVRLARLYPMIFITVLMGALTLTVRLLATHTLTFYQIIIATLSGLLLLPTSVLISVYPEDLYPINGALWSLFFELAVNFAYAPLTRWLTNKRLIVLAFIFGVGMCFIAKANDGVGVGWGVTTFLYGFTRAAYPFVIGVLLFRFSPSMKMGGLTTLLLATTLIAVLFAPVFPGNWIYEMLILTLVFPPLVYFGAACVNGPAVNKACLTLGALSYPLYLTHHAVLRITANAVQLLHMHIDVSIIAALCFVLSIASSWLLLKIFDEPVRDWFSRKRKTRTENKKALAT